MATYQIKQTHLSFHQKWCHIDAKMILYLFKKSWMFRYLWVMLMRCLQFAGFLPLSQACSLLSSSSRRQRTGDCAEPLYIHAAVSGRTRRRQQYASWHRDFLLVLWGSPRARKAPFKQNQSQFTSRAQRGTGARKRSIVHSEVSFEITY